MLTEFWVVEELLCVFAGLRFVSPCVMFLPILSHVLGFWITLLNEACGSFIESVSVS